MMARWGLAPFAPFENKAGLAAFACFAAMSAAIGLFVLYTSPYWPQGGVPAGIYGMWTLIAVLVAGPLGLLMARGWFGMAGTLGWLRAIVGTIVSLVFAAVIGGTLILPVYGTIYAPLMVLTAVLAQPLVGAVWLAGGLIAHWIIAQDRRAQQALRQRAQDQEMASLSALSQTYFYRK